jgi:murein DD-endopeptidase MepM/ murein hydrolase activator NlpD
LHYEVRMGGHPVNPYAYLAKAPTAQSAKRDFPF